MYSYGQPVLATNSHDQPASCGKIKPCQPASPSQAQPESLCSHGQTVKSHNKNSAREVCAAWLTQVQLWSARSINCQPAMTSLGFIANQQGNCRKPWSSKSSQHNQPVKFVYPSPTSQFHPQVFRRTHDHQPYVAMAGRAYAHSSHIQPWSANH